MKTPPVIVLTGATSGLGRLAALELARKGAHLALVARNQARADALRTEIEQAVPGAKPEIFLADLSLLAEVCRVGRQIDAYYPRIDVLINNAGVHAFSQRDRKSTRLNSSHGYISYAVFCLKKKQSTYPRMQSV